jgi:diguanylate cyclase (GGDEF)-like protein
VPVEHNKVPRLGGAAEEAELQARLRDQAGRQRDAAAGRRDDVSSRRDQSADARDQDARRAATRHQHLGEAQPATHADVAAVVQAAESDRAYAHVDRVAAGNDRADAAIDRQEALADRMAAARDRRAASLDGLTGVYNREAGLLEMARDLARASRTGQLLVVAFLDVDHLKDINDTLGHAAGDRALIAVADTLTTALRPYDLIVRYGGDEFLCTVEGMDMHAARDRFTRVNELLRTRTHGMSVTVGLVRLRNGETTESVIARADADLYQQRQQRRRQHRT